MIRRGLAVLALLPIIAFAQKPDCTLVPGWQQEGPPRSYQADNLFDYMNGNAEGYLIYGFRHLQGVTCVKPGAKLLLDVFEMADPEAAYGIFCANRDARQPVEPVGMGAQIQSQKTIVAKDRYYVEIASETAEGAVEPMRGFAKALAQCIPGRDAPPEILNWFPAEKLDRASVRLIPESVLGLRALRRGYVAQYDAGKAFLVREPSPGAAKETLQNLRRRYPDAREAKLGEEAFQAEDRYLGPLIAFRKGQYIGGFASGKSGEPGIGIAKALAGKIP